MKNDVFFSVIVVSLNASGLMGITMKSIIEQTCTDYEVIVKDGISSDDTLSYIPQSDRIHVYSEKDSGIYEAMNQAIRYSKGKYLIFMNCGDRFYNSEVLTQMKKCIGNEVYAYTFGDYSRDEIIHQQPLRLSDTYLFRTPLCHQTIFFLGDLLRNTYQYDTMYRILADYDLELRLYRANTKIKHFDICVCQYQGAGISESKNGIKLKKVERKKILRKHFPLGKRLLLAGRYWLTMPRVRMWIVYSPKSPLFLKKIYQATVNHINRR